MSSATRDRKNFLPTQEIAAGFDRLSAQYERFDALEREVGRRLLERVSYARRAVRNVVDLGCGTGRCTQLLREQYPEAQVSGLDISGGMLRELQRRSGGSNRMAAVRGNFEKMPYLNRSVDLVISNLALQWASDLAATFREIRRVLKTEAMLLFAIPGSASFPEMRSDSKPSPTEDLPVRFSDLTEIGDLLMAEGFAEPVMDNEIITLQYPDESALRREMSATGSMGFGAPRCGESANQKASVSVEILYGTAFGPAEGKPVRTDTGEVATFPVDRLGRIGNNFAK